MAKWHPGTWLMAVPLTRRFAVLSLVIIAAMTAALSFVISVALRNDMLAREWHVTAAYIRLQAREHLTVADFAAPRTAGAQAHFRTFYDQVMRMPEIMRVKVYDRERIVLWSDEPRLIGQRFPDNPQLAKALDGETIAHLEVSKKKAENVFEQPARFVELYVPLEIGPGIAGVVETYKSPEEVFANIRGATRIVVATALAGGVFLWVALFGIVRGAAQRIDRQHQALDQRSRDLAAANEETRAVQAQLVAAGRMAAVGEVVTAIAHGIRNPLANIRASAQVAQLACRRLAGASLAVDSLADVVSEVDRLAARVSEMLKFVRPTERRAQRMDLNAVVRAALRALTARIEESKVHVEPRLAAALPVMAGDAVLLEQALGAILENALDAMAGGPGTLTVTTGTERASAGDVRVFVEMRDTGPGIPPDQLGKVFELFYTTKAQGTGLGLALAKKFVEADGGTLTVASETGEGTVFHASFPADASG